MRLVRVSIGIIFLGLVSGCANSYIDDAAAKKANGAFNTHLHQGYLKLARDEASQGDWQSGQYFAGKASAAAGPGIGPDSPSLRDISKKNKMVWDAYDHLKSALSSGAPNASPKACAEAQVAFDHWIEQKEECVQPRDIQGAYAAFKAAMARCQPGSSAAPRTFIVFFDFDSAALTNEAKKILDTVAGYIKAGKGAKLILTGHADTSGNPRYNEGLSLRRANSVWSGLIDRGLNGNNMKVYAKGESAPLVSTGDGVKEPQNRRVHIDIQ